MRRFLLFVTCSLLIGLYASAQEKDVAALSIRVQQPEREYLTSASCRLLKTKMTQILTQNGIVNDIPSNRFVLTAKANLLNKDIIAGSPARISEQLEMTFIIGDVVDNVKYGTYVMNLTGVGQNENQAVQMAIKTIKINDVGFESFVEQAKSRIVTYYRENESKILREADILFEKGQYDEAIYYLSMIPDACGDCYEHCQDKMQVIIRAKRDRDAQSLLSRAKAAWAKSPNASGANEAYPLIAQIDPQASCYGEVSPFLKTITAKLMADDKRAWELKVKQYEDQKAREQRDFEFKVQQYTDEKAREQRNFEARQIREARNAALRQQEIRAARDVAMEYARNQPDVVYYESNNTILLW